MCFVFSHCALAVTALCSRCDLVIFSLCSLIVLIPYCVLSPCPLTVFSHCSHTVCVLTIVFSHCVCSHIVLSLCSLVLSLRSHCVLRCNVSPHAIGFMPTERKHLWKLFDTISSHGSIPEIGLSPDSQETFVLHVTRVFKEKMKGAGSDTIDKFQTHLMEMNKQVQ